jgi:hypothetical protein
MFCVFCCYKNGGFESIFLPSMQNDSNDIYYKAFYGRNNSKVWSNSKVWTNSKFWSNSKVWSLFVLVTSTLV